MPCGISRVARYLEDVDRDRYGRNEDYSQVNLDLAELEGFSGLP